MVGGRVRIGGATTAGLTEPGLERRRANELGRAETGLEAAKREIPVRKKGEPRKCQAKRKGRRTEIAGTEIPRTPDSDPLKRTERPKITIAVAGSGISSRTR